MKVLNINFLSLSKNSRRWKTKVFYINLFVPYLVPHLVINEMKNEHSSAAKTVTRAGDPKVINALKVGLMDLTLKLQHLPNQMFI